MKKHTLCISILWALMHLFAIAKDPPLALWISPTSHLAKLILYVTNETDKSVLIWSEGCSWGHETVSFTIRIGERTVQIKKKPVDFLRNLPIPVTVPARESQLLAYDLFSEEWVWSRKLPVQGKVILVRAILEIPTTDEARKKGVFVGKLHSEWAALPALPKHLQLRGDK